KTVLTRLSGKSRKRGKPPTAGILLSGLFVLLQVLDYLDSMGNDLNQIAKLRAPQKIPAKLDKRWGDTFAVKLGVTHG
ncbi:MAG: hypothetical protein LBT05_10745, partial [Planctomycetaceae bacterium]|nr:hypothetical protein [Planctomycetaceae bacterium]